MSSYAFPRPIYRPSRTGRTPDHCCRCLARYSNPQIHGYPVNFPCLGSCFPADCTNLQYACASQFTSMPRERPVRLWRITVSMSYAVSVGLTKDWMRIFLPSLSKVGGDDGKWQSCLKYLSPLSRISIKRKEQKMLPWQAWMGSNYAWTLCYLLLSWGLVTDASGLLGTRRRCLVLASTRQISYGDSPAII